MKYMLLIYLDEQKPLSEAERQECYVESTQLAQALHNNGQYLGANPLHATSMATSVRVRDGKKFVTDGPFAETKEWLGGLTIVNVPDDESARMWAGRVAEGCGWPQEVRRFKAGSLQALVLGG